jgi:signal peptidase I
VKGFWRTTAWVVAIGGAIVLLLYLFVFDTWEIPGDDPMLGVSIEPTLRVGDRVLTRRQGDKTIGQLVRCRNPADANKFIVGRLFGTERDIVEVKHEQVYVSGKVYGGGHGCPRMSLTHPATGQIEDLVCSETGDGTISYQTLHGAAELGMEADTYAPVETGKAFLVSDNRHIHNDSRDYGQIDFSTCEHIVFRLWGKSYTDSSRRNTILW